MNNWCFDDQGTINYMLGVTDYVSAYVAYNMGYTYSMNLDFQLYDSSIPDEEEIEEDTLN